MELQLSIQQEAQLRLLLERFVADPFPSVKLANEIEGFIAEELPEGHPLQELADDLAQYRPEGGEFLFSEREMRPKISRWLDHIVGVGGN
jgi:hypothetical protein